MSLAQAREDIIAKLEADGYQVADDPRNVTPPCLLVCFPRTITSVGACLYEGELPVTVIGTAPANLDAAAWLLDTTETLLTLLNATGATASTTTVQGSQARLPTYELLVSIPL